MVVWFRVRRVQRLPSLHATHEIPKVLVSRVSRRDALLTVCRGNAQLFLPGFFPLIPVANYTWGMFVGRARGDRAEFRRVFFSFSLFFQRKTRSKTVEMKRPMLVSRRNAVFVRAENPELGVTANGNSHARREKFRNSLYGYRAGRVIAISCLSVIENLCLAHARKGAASRVRAREERRVTSSRGGRVVAFSSR